MKKFFTVLAGALLGFGMQAQVTVPATASGALEGWENYVYVEAAPTANFQVDNGYVLLEGWTGVAGDALKVEVDATGAPTGVSAIVNGSAVSLPGYMSISAKSNYYTAYLYGSSDYVDLCIDKEGEGYILFYGYFYPADGGDAVWGYTCYEWSGVAEAVEAQINKDSNDLGEAWNALNDFAEETMETFPGYLVLKSEEISAAREAIETAQAELQARGEAAMAGSFYYEPISNLDQINEQVMAIVNGIEEVTLAITEEHEADEEAVNQLSQAMQEFNTMVAEELPGYAEVNANAIGALTATIEALNNKMNEAMEAAFETGVYNGLTGQEITEANETLIGLVAGLEEAAKAIEDAYNEDLEAVNQLAQAMQEFNSQVAEELPGYAVANAEAFAAMTATIEALNNKMVAALEAAYETCVYEGLTGQEITEANEQLIGLVAGMEEAAKAIEDAYNEDLEAVNQLTQDMQEFNNQVAEEFPGYAVANAEAFAAMTATIEALNNKMVAALEAAYETCVYEGLTGQEITEANEQLIGLVAGMEEATKAIEDEYAQDEEAVNQLAQAMQEFNNQVAEEFPGYAVANAEAFAAMTATIEALNNKMSSALEAAFETGVYEGLTGVEVTDANEQFMGLMAGMEEAINAIQDEYDADVENINALATAYQQFLEETEETAPGYLVAHAEEIAALNATIEALNGKVNAAMEAAFETGVYEGLTGAEVVDANETFIGLVAGVDEDAAAILAEYEADVESVNTLANAYQEFVDMMDEAWPGYLVNHADELAALNATIEALNNKVNAAMEAAFETGVYEGLTGAEVTEANETLIGLMTGVEEEMNATDELLEAYNEEWMDWYNAFDAIQNSREFPAYAIVYEDQVAAVSAAIQDIYAVMADGVEAWYETGVYPFPSQEEMTTVSEQVMALVVDYSEKLAAIENAYEEDYDKLAPYAAAVEEGLDSDDEEEFMAAIYVYAQAEELLYALMEAQYVALTETTVYVSPLTDEDMEVLDALLKAYEDVVTGIVDITSDVEGVQYFDLNGMNVKNPVAGKVYIRVLNGQATKVLVK